jgi:chromosomal replication initiation ATPase DnaA
MSDYPNIRSIFPDITPEQIRGIIWAVSEDLKTTKEIPKLTDILEVVANVTGISVDLLRSPNRCREYSNARKIYAMIARETTHYGFAEISSQINKDHASVVYYIKTGRAHVLIEPEFAYTLGLCRERVSKIVNKNHLKPKI